jgi:hypothetical protein
VDQVSKADYQGKEVDLDKPFRLPSGSSKKFGVYVKDGDKVVKVTFGDPNMEIRRDDPEARSSFRARHNCDTQTDKTSAAYWSCRLWSDDSVSEIVKENEDTIASDGKYHYLYEVINKVNNKIYYGVHSTKNLQDNYLGSGVLLRRAVKKYGAENFEKTVLEFFPDRESLLLAEEILVDESVVKSEDFYNLCLGGKSYIDSIKDLCEDDFVLHQKNAGKIGGKAAYESKSPTEKLEWHKKGRQSSSGTLGKKLKIKDLESYKLVRRESAIKRNRYFCPFCDMTNLDGGNLSQHLKARHDKDISLVDIDKIKDECRMWEDGVSVSDLTKSEIPDDETIYPTTLLKVFEEERIVYGWASVVTKSGKPVVDYHDDIISPNTMHKAASDFMECARTAKAMHKGGKIGEIIHSLPLTRDIAKSLGIECEYEGWIIGMKIRDDEVWKRVLSGELKEFSIGGRGLRRAL